MDITLSLTIGNQTYYIPATTAGGGGTGDPAVLLEDGSSYLLLESGDHILLE